MKTILTAAQLDKAIDTLARELYQRHAKSDEVVYVGIQQGGVTVGNQIMDALRRMDPDKPVRYGQLDITFYRDDIRQEILAPDTMNIPFDIENKQVVLIDDVLFTGRTIKAALDVLLDYGRPAKVELCVLVDRREHRQFPIQPDYTGVVVNSDKKDKVKLIKNDQGQSQVVLITQ